MPVDVRLIAILDPSAYADPLDQVRAAEDGGATAVQVRMKNSSAGDMLDAVRRIVPALGIPVYVNDRADVALAAGAAGVHVGTEDPPPAALRAMAPRGFRIGVSVGDEREAASVGGAEVDYWSIGAMYETGTKPDAGSPIGPAGVARLARLAPPAMPIVAIGGITAASVRDLVAAGADGVAVSSAIFSAADPAAAARRLRDAVDAARSKG